MAENTTQSAAPSVKKYYDYAQQQIDEQAILDKYNAATIAQFNAQREQNRQTENQFYNQMYNTQKTAMDTIRQSNAAAVSSGASRGVQAANELSALLGLQQESVESATEIAQANRQTAQEETAAVLENVLKAYQQTVSEKQELVSQGIEAASVDAQNEANRVSAMEAQTNIASTLASAAQNGTQTYLTTLQNLGYDYSGEASNEGYASLQQALNGIKISVSGPEAATLFTYNDWAGASTGAAKASAVANNIEQICKSYGLNYDDFKNDLEVFKKSAGIGADGLTSIHTSAEEKAISGVDISGTGKRAQAELQNALYQGLIAKVQAAYLNKLNETNKKS